MHDEVFESAAQDAASPARDLSTSAASSPSEAYANLTLESRESPAAAAAMGSDAAHPSPTPPRTDQPPSRPPPRASSPAKRLHSDMDTPAAEQQDLSKSSPRATKPLPTPSQRSARATSIDMADAPAAEESSASSNTLVDESPSDLPSLDDQVATVLEMHHRPLTDGQEGYVVSERWLARVFARTTENRGKPEQFDKAATEGEIGPIDNSNLLDTAVPSAELKDVKGEPFVALRPGLTMGQDFEILPREAWDLIISWYGVAEGSPVVKRYVHDTAVDQVGENLQFEVYPPIFTIRRVRKAIVNGQIAPSPRIVASRSYGYRDFLMAAKKAVGITMKTKVRMWRVLHTAPTEQSAAPPPGMLTPEASPQRGSPVSATRDQDIPLPIGMEEFCALRDGMERELVAGKDETANEKYNGSSTLHTMGLAEDQVLILEEQDETGQFLTSSSSGAKSSQALVRAVDRPNRPSQSNNTSRRGSPARSGPLTRGRTRSGRTRGTVGLINLGNTCYMNSALQCIRSVEELSFYFLGKLTSRFCEGAFLTRS